MSGGGWSWEKHGGSGSSSGGGGWSWSTNPKPAPHGGGGLFGWLGSAGGWVGSKLELAGRDIEGIPGGLYHLGGAFAHDLAVSIEHPERQIGPTWGEVAKHPIGAWEHPRGGGQLGPQVAGFAEGVKTSVEHPLRDPFQTALTVIPAVSALGRASEIGIAGDLGQPARALQVGDRTVPLIGSRNASVRLLQRGYDRMMQNALNREQAASEGAASPGRFASRLARHAQARAAGALHEELGIQQRMAATPAQLLDQAAMKLSKLPGSSGNRLKQAALELTSHQVTPEEAALYHESQAAAGVPGLHVDTAKLYRQLQARNLVHLDETRPVGRQVFINPAFPRLAKADERLAQVQARGDQIASDHALMTPAELQARVDAPGRIRAGAHYETPTPAKLGIESPALTAARAELDRVAALHERALNRDAAWLEATKTRDLGALSPADAQARLAELDRVYEGLVQRMIPRVSPYGGDLSKAEQLDRNFLNSRAGRGRYRGMSRRQTVKQEEWDLADAKIRDLAASGTHPAYQQAAELIRERDALRRALADRSLAVLGGEDPGALPSAPAYAHASVPMPSNPHTNTINFLGNRLEEMRARVARLEDAAARRVKPTGIVGGEHARPGRGYTYEGVSEKKLAKAENAARASGPVVGKPREPIGKKPYTGRALELGLRPKDITGAASRHLRVLQRFENTDRLRRVALSTGSDVRRSSRDVLVAMPDETQADIPAAIREVFGQQKRTVDTSQELAAHAEDAGRSEGLRAALQMRIQGWLDKVDASKSEQIGTPAPDGYRWVDEKMIQRLQDDAVSRGGAWAGATKVVDDVNSAVTALTVYFKVGHIGTRVLTNAVTNLIQGSLNPIDVARTWKLWNTLSEEERARMLSAAGQHGFAALPAEARDIVGRTASRGAQYWARHADAPFRFNALAYELRKAGYTTVDQTRAALDALENHGEGLPAHEWSKVSTAARRADREAIAYDRLNAGEKRFLTRGIWFYPWIKGSTLFTVRSIIEHPYKMGALAEEGVYGRQQQEKQLGPTPFYEAGLFPLGAPGGASPLVSDFSTFSPFATAGELAHVPANPQEIAGFLNPVLGAGNLLVNGLNQYGSPSQTPYKDALLALAASTPEQQIAEAAALQGQDQSGRMFEKTPLSALLRYLVGPATPRHVNKGALAKAAAREKSGRR